MPRLTTWTALAAAAAGLYLLRADTPPRAASPAAADDGDQDRADLPQEATDHRVRERVRAKLPELARRPEAIEVVVNAGHVGLRGEVLDREVEPLLLQVLALPGVQGIDNRLTLRAEGDEPPELEASRRAARRARHGRSRYALPLLAVAPIALVLGARADRRERHMDARHQH